jgi:hypothetical protein
MFLLCGLMAACLIISSARIIAELLAKLANCKKKETKNNKNRSAEEDKTPK